MLWRCADNVVAAQTSRSRVPSEGSTMNEIRIPRLGWSMEEGVFVGWLKNDGEPVAVGEPLFELEGEKAAQEIESVDAGRLQIVANGPQPGDEVKVGALLGYLLGPHEVAPPVADEPRDLQGVEQTVAFLNQSSSTRSPKTHEPVATPRAKRAAAEVGVDWKTLSGSGRDGRIRESDVRAANVSRAGATSVPTRRDTVSGLSPRRKAIADRLRISRERTIPVTLTSRANATNIVALREQFKVTNSQLIPAFTDIVACLVARIIQRHPHMAVRWQDDAPGRSLIPVGDDISIGIAVDTPDGLLVPVVKQAARRSLLRVADDSHALIERARSGRLTAADMHGAVISLSNLGAQGIDGFTPIINYPEIAILGLGAIRREAVVLNDDRVASQLRITLSLTFDHAAIDGAPAAAFLRDVVEAIENPAAYLLSE